MTVLKGRPEKSARDDWQIWQRRQDHDEGSLLVAIPGP